MRCFCWVASFKNVHENLFCRNNSLYNPNGPNWRKTLLIFTTIDLQNLKLFLKNVWAVFFQRKILIVEIYSKNSPRLSFLAETWWGETAANDFIFVDLSCVDLLYQGLKREIFHSECHSRMKFLVSLFGLENCWIEIAESCF